MKTASSSKDFIFGMDSYMGDRPVYEDRSCYETIHTQAGIPLIVGIVADGVGGEKIGERAAQLAVDITLAELKASQSTNIAQILIRAIQTANLAIYQDAKARGVTRMASTISAAVIDLSKGKKQLYVANVGDSRVYLLRGKKLTQLTIDHNYANLKYWPNEIQGAVSPDIQDEHLIRVLGIDDSVKVDIGFYVGTNDPEVAEGRGWDGLPLDKGDSVLLCSDGLIKLAVGGVHHGTAFATNDEIVQTLSSHEGTKAAEKLTSYAKGRAADDNVTVVSIQTQDSNRAMRAAYYQYRWAAVAGLVLFVVLLVVAGLLFQNQDELTVANAENTRQASIFQTSTAIAALPTETSTPSPSPTAQPTALPTNAPNAIGFYGSQSLMPNQPLSLSFPTILHLQTDAASRGRVYIDTGELVFQPISAEGRRIDFQLITGNELFLVSEDFDIYMRLPGTSQLLLNLANVGTEVGAAFLRYNQSGQVELFCYSGLCQYNINYGGGAWTSVDEGKVVFLTTGALATNPALDISTEQHVFVNDFLEGFNEIASASDAANYVSNFIPTPTFVPPPDNDRDGVPNRRDNCPDVPGPADLGGCPPATAQVPQATATFAGSN